MNARAQEREEQFRIETSAVAAYLRDRASPYAERVSAWWLEVTQREGCKPMSYYDQ
ncbi:MAG TPA: hypothetical protein VFX59_17930 [Polyangiales bacterium]|nr:hypothetical protein [Polyangiales bacterium]